MINFQGVKKEAISEGVGVAFFEVFFRGLRVRLVSYAKLTAALFGIIRVMKGSAPLVLWQWLTLIIS